MGYVFLKGFKKHQYIIKIDKHKTFDYVSEDVNQGLEDGRGIEKTKRHDKIFIVPTRGVKYCLPFIPLPYP